MKYLPALIIGLLLSATAAAQENNTDTVPIILHDDYSNRKPVDPSVMLNDNMRQERSTLVIIDDKIYSLRDKTYQELDKSAIKSLRVIKDEHSQTPIKYVIIIGTKKD